HLESCLGCTRRYRVLADDIREVVSILKLPPPARAARTPLVYSGMRWSLAAAAVAAGFLLGRMTTADVLAVSGSHGLASSRARVASVDRGSAGGSRVASSYGFYIDSLIGGQDEADAGQLATVDTGETDSEGL